MPQLTGIDLSQYTPATITASYLSSTFSNDYRAALAIDNNFNTLAASTETAPNTNWLAVQLPDQTRVGFVAVYNRRDFSSIQHWLGSFEVSLGSAPADPNGVVCGTGAYDANMDQSLPYVFDCGGSTAGSTLTIFGRDCGSGSANCIQDSKLTRRRSTARTMQRHTRSTRLR